MRYLGALSSPRSNADQYRARSHHDKRRIANHAIAAAVARCRKLAIAWRGRTGRRARCLRVGGGSSRGGRGRGRCGGVRCCCACCGGFCGGFFGGSSSCGRGSSFLSCCGCSFFCSCCSCCCSCSSCCCCCSCCSCSCCILNDDDCTINERNL